MPNCSVLAKIGPTLIMGLVLAGRGRLGLIALLQQTEPYTIGVQPAISQFEPYPFELKVL